MTIMAIQESQVSLVIGEFVSKDLILLVYTYTCVIIDHYVCYMHSLNFRSSILMLITICTFKCFQ